MSSSPEDRPFVSRPSPLHSTLEEPVHRRLPISPSSRGMNTPRTSTIGVAQTSAGVQTISDRAAVTRVADLGRVPPDSTRKRGSHRRRTSPGVPYERQPRQHGTVLRPESHLETTSTRHDGSIGEFRPAGLNDLIDAPDQDVLATLNPGTFSNERRAKTASLNATKAPFEPTTTATGAFENILDRSPTPPYEAQIQREQQGTMGRESSRRIRGSEDERRGLGDTRTKISIEEALGVPVKDPSQAVAKTFVRPEPPNDLLEYPVIFNPRVTMMVSITQPLYIGGGCVDGRLNVHIRGTRLDDIRLGRASIDIVGIEELSFTRKAMFMSVASELIDEDHPPPASMLEPLEAGQNVFWKVKPSRCFLPFKLKLPLNVGPGPFSSVRAKIRYVIHGTIMIIVNGQKSIVRTCRDIRIISALDPESALLPLERPLLSTEEHSLRYGGHNTLKVTAGLHRAVWVAGTAAYVDVNIVNNTNRHVKKIKCKLRRHICAYKNTVALAENKSAGHLRVPSWIERKTLSHSELNIGSRWKGVKGSQLDVMTCEIDIPRNQASIKMGRYFEVKYFIDIGVCTPAARTVRVQLPVTIVHMNSLDIIPNDLPDVTAAIADLYGTEAAKQYLAGRAFTAPREQAALKVLPEPLVPTQAALQPQRASVGKTEGVQKQSGDGTNVGPDRNGLGFDVASFFGGVQETHGEANSGRRKEIWDEGSVDAKPRKSTSLVNRGSRRNMTTREMLKQLEGLKA